MMKQADHADTHILVVKDDDIERETLCDALVGHGYKTQSRRGGLDAVAEVQHELFNLSLMDYNMPDIDGMSAARIVCDLIFENNRPKIVVLTETRKGVPASEASLKRRFGSVIARPFKQSALTACIDRATEMAAGQAARRKQHAAPALKLGTPKPLGEPSGKTAASASVTIAKPWILPVENHHMHRYALWHMLEHDEKSADTAGNGFGAVQETRDTDYDLVLINDRLPDIDGLGMAGLVLRSKVEKGRLSIVTLAIGADLLAEQEATTGSAFIIVVTKPQDLHILLATVRRHFSHQPRKPHE